MKKINLIPPYRKEEISRAYNLRTLLKWEAELAAILALLVLALISINAIVKINLSVAVNDSSVINKTSEQYKAIEQYDDDTKNTNAVISNVGKIQNAQFYWSKFLAKLNDKVISGVAISKITTKNYDITVGGKVNTRDNLITFRDNIINDSCFTDVDLPLSNLVARDNIDFQMTFKIKRECLK